ncbi:MAG TPA: hypothetical protein VMV29_16615 [Ktedonobacterales bacterium]|nr:hypothetical protein [Ktedonobacterales bacterium]
MSGARYSASTPGFPPHGKKGIAARHLAMRRSYVIPSTRMFYIPARRPQEENPMLQRLPGARPTTSLSR